MNEAKFKIGDRVIAEGDVENVGHIEADSFDIETTEAVYKVRFEDTSWGWYFQYELEYAKEEEHG